MEKNDRKGLVTLPQRIVLYFGGSRPKLGIVEHKLQVLHSMCVSSTSSYCTKLDANMGSAASVPKLRGETIFILTIEFELPVSQ